MEKLKFDSNRKLTQEEKDKIHTRLAYSFAYEGMPLTEQDIQNLDDILSERKTVEQVVDEIDKNLKKAGLIK